MPMGPGMTNMFGLNENEFVQKSIPSLSEAPSHVRQSVIHSARQRYMGAVPLAGQGHGMASGTGGVAGGHVIGHVVSDDNADLASESISQWSQWLKGNAPAPVY